MSKVGIASYGITKFSKEASKIESVLLESTKKLFDNCSNLGRTDIDAVLVSTNNNSKYLSAILSEMSGIEPKIAHTIESLCNSGTNAIVSAYSYIASGLADVVLVSGAERYDSPGQILEWDNSRGEFKHPIFWASIFTKAYKREFAITDEELAIVPVKNHKQAQNNPNALSETHRDARVRRAPRRRAGRAADCGRPPSRRAPVPLREQCGVRRVPRRQAGPGEPALATAQRELREEAGYEASTWTRLGVVHTVVAYSTEAIELFLAEGLTHLGGQALDHGEFVDVETMPYEDVLAAAERGEITDVKTVAAIWYLSRRFPG